MTMVLWYLLAFCRAVIGIAFAVSFVGKARDLPAFRDSIARFDLLPSGMAGTAAGAILAGELFVVIAAAVGGRLLLAGFVAAFLLLAVFTTALALVLKRRIHTSCNCFGASDKAITPYDIWRNAGFLLCALGGCGALAAPATGQTSLSLAEYGVSALGAAVFVAITAQIGEIAQLFRSG
jgi:hypothetical protein